MLICTLDRDKAESLNAAIKEKNRISPLSRFSKEDFTEEDKETLNRIGLVNSEGKLLEEIQPAMDILSNPHAVVKLTFTGGEGTYEHNISFDDSFHNHVSFTATPGRFSIDDETNPQSILKIMEDFVGKSNLKSINLSKKFNKYEALVVAAILDMERKSCLRAFIDEIPVIHNSYNTNMIWRIINSTSSSIQWFVSIINEVIGNHDTISLKQVQEAINDLVAKEVLTQNGGLYQLSGELAPLSGRMVIIDNILSVQTSKIDEEEDIITAGFTCVQSGVHDLLFLDYNGKDIVFETITSVRLLKFLERFLNCETYFSYLKAEK